MPVLVFDSYGTLFDLDVLVSTATHILNDPEKAEAVCKSWRRHQLEFAWQSILMERYQDFDKLTSLALDAAIKQVFDGNSNPVLKDALMSTNKHLPLFEDVLPTLETVESKKAMLSNGTFRSLQTLADHTGILFSFDYILSVDPIRTYKPARASYKMAHDKFAVSKEEVWFVSSNTWDISGAKSYGFKTFWCNRAGEFFDGFLYEPDVEISSLTELINYM
jgi:2-haloacid dehalogenase